MSTKKKHGFCVYTFAHGGIGRTIEESDDFIKKGKELSRAEERWQQARGTNYYIPLEDIRNTNDIKYVVKNGRLYNAETMDQIWPKKEKLKELWWWNDGP